MMHVCTSRWKGDRREVCAVHGSVSYIKMCAIAASSAYHIYSVVALVMWWLNSSSPHVSKCIMENASRLLQLQHGLGMFRLQC
mmetsp:Transcript_7385/g.21054  ORF Transcript_7385/g.21054 Transcript_7385/m.21054 type:complete len:83 (+) Transcript_7385:80-328(+)